MRIIKHTFANTIHAACIYLLYLPRNSQRRVVCGVVLVYMWRHVCHPPKRLLALLRSRYTQDVCAAMFAHIKRDFRREYVGSVFGARCAVLYVRPDR